jgi:hypothetical protein
MHGLPLRIHRQQVETSEGKDNQAAIDGDLIYLPFAPDNKTEKLLEKKETSLKVHICTKVKNPILPKCS